MGTVKVRCRQCGAKNDEPGLCRICGAELEHPVDLNASTFEEHVETEVQAWQEIASTPLAPPVTDATPGVRRDRWPSPTVVIAVIIVLVGLLAVALQL